MSSLRPYQSELPEAVSLGDAMFMQIEVKLPGESIVALVS